MRAGGVEPGGGGEGVVQTEWCCIIASEAWLVGAQPPDHLPSPNVDNVLRAIWLPPTPRACTDTAQDRIQVQANSRLAARPTRPGRRAVQPAGAAALPHCKLCLIVPVLTTHMIVTAGPHARGTSTMPSQKRTKWIKQIASGCGPPRRPCGAANSRPMSPPAAPVSNPPLAAQRPAPPHWLDANSKWRPMSAAGRPGRA